MTIPPLIESILLAALSKLFWWQVGRLAEKYKFSTCIMCGDDSNHAAMCASCKIGAINLTKPIK